MPMKFLEKDLEDIVFETPNKFLRERGIPIFGKKLRQVRIGNYGICDLITIRPELYPNHVRWIVTIYEFKKDIVDNSTFLQILRYAKGIKRYTKKRYEGSYIDIELVLVGSSINESDGFPYINEFVESLDIYTYKYGFDGLVFNRNPEWFLKDEGFEKRNGF